jgi:hypothetical protein
MPINLDNGTRLDRLPLPALTIVVIGVPASLWSIHAVLSGGPDLGPFATIATWFFVLAGAFLFKNGLRNAQWCTAPAFMTIVATMEFVAIPFWRFATSADQIDSSYTNAMFYVFLGFCMFWLSCCLLIKPCKLTFSPTLPSGSPRIFLAAIAMLAVGTISNVVLWKLGITAYAAATLRYDTSISAAESLEMASRMLAMAMLISGIEVFGKRSKSLVMRLIFGTAFILDIGFGLISGMKMEVLMPLFFLAIVLGITQGRFPRVLWAIPLVFILIYPFVDAYRANLNAGYSAQINTKSGLIAALTKSVEDVSSEYGGSGQALHTGIKNFGSRLSVLTLVRNVLELPSPSLLSGDETVWMAPVYPFIPRVLWRDKPILNKGQRMSWAMGIGGISSTNVPGIADMYIIGGTKGVLLGMFLWGACLQIYMNVMGGVLSERDVFFYVLMLIPLTNIEHDTVGLISGAVQNAIVFLLLSRFVYGRRVSPMPPAASLVPIAVTQ